MGLIDELQTLETLNTDKAASSPATAKTDNLKPDADQPRKVIDGDELEALALSVKQTGILQPILVREPIDGEYVIIAGERRWRAAKLAGLNDVPIVVRAEHTSYDQMIENVQRADLSHSEVGEWICAQLANGERPAEIARRLGRSKTWVSRYSIYSDLPDCLRKQVNRVGMETAKLLHKAWIADPGQTEAFLESAADITRDEAKRFMDDLANVRDDHTSRDATEIVPTGLASEPNASDVSEVAEISGHQPDARDDIARQKESIDQYEPNETPSVAFNPQTALESELAERRISIRCYYDADSGKSRIHIDNDIVLELAEGEEGFFVSRSP